MAFNRDAVLRLLREALERGATEIHFKVPNRPLFRIDGALLPMGDTHLTPQSTHAIGMALCGLANLELPLAQITDRRFSFGLASVGRFHVWVYRQRGSLAIIAQRSGLEIPSLDALGFEPAVEQLTLYGRGLSLLVGGRRRSGLLASLVDRYNASARGYVMVVEEPLHFLHRDAMATIAQRGVSDDVPSIAVAVQTAVHQNADLIACGDVRDREAAEAVLDAAEIGVPVLACAGAPTVEDAIPWLIRHFPAADRELARLRIERVLKAVLCIPDAGPTEVHTPGSPG